MVTARSSICLSFAAGVLAVASSGAVQAQPVPTDRVQPKIDIRLLAARQYLELSRRYNSTSAIFRSGKAVTCGTGTDCHIDAEVLEQFDSSGTLTSCIVKTPEVTVRRVSGNRTNMFWNLVIPSGAKATYEFDSRNGLLIISDQHGAMTGGTTISTTQVRKAHRHTGPRREVVYFPIVLQNLSTASPFLCAAGDPKIIND